MIRFHVDAVLRVLDGFTGKPPSPSAIHLFVDGTAYRPIVKDGGYYVLKGLVPGEHQLVLQGAFYGLQGAERGSIYDGCAASTLSELSKNRLLWLWWWLCYALADT